MDGQRDDEPVRNAAGNIADQRIAMKPGPVVDVYQDAIVIREHGRLDWPIAVLPMNTLLAGIAAKELDGTNPGGTLDLSVIYSDLRHHPNLLWFTRTPSDSDLRVRIAEQRLREARESREAHRGQEGS